MEKKNEINAMDCRELIQTAFHKIEGLFQDYERRNNRVFSGFAGLGFMPGELTALQGYNASDLALNIARFVASEGKHVIYLSNLTHEDVSFKLLSAESYVQLKRLEDGHIESTDWSKLTDAAGRLSDISLSINRNRAASISDMLLIVERLNEKQPVGMVVVDDPVLVRGLNELDPLQKLARGMDISVLVASPIANLEQTGPTVDCVYTLVKLFEDTLNVEPVGLGEGQEPASGSILLVRETVSITNTRGHNRHEVSMKLSFYPEIATFSHVDFPLDSGPEDLEESL